MFICTLDEETDVSCLFGNSEFIYRAPIGYDDETDHVYSVFVIFSPHAAYGDGTCYELVFRIVESSLDGEYLYDYHDGLQTKAFIREPSQRATVAGLVMHVVERHIDEFKPLAVEMVTYVENLPNEALQKFHRIAALFGEKGYRAGPADPWHGRWIWMMRLPEVAGDAQNDYLQDGELP